jgi:hypothetical protein
MSETASTALFVFGYPVSLVVIARWIPVVRERRWKWFVAHETAVAAIVAGWVLKSDARAVAINGTWLGVAAVWYLSSARRQGS